MKFKEFEWIGGEKCLICDYGDYFAEVYDTGHGISVKIIYGEDKEWYKENKYNCIEDAIKKAQNKIRKLIINQYFEECEESRQYLKGYIQAIKDIKGVVKEAECEAVTNLFNEAGLELMGLGERKDLIS